MSTHIYIDNETSATSQPGEAIEHGGVGVSNINANNSTVPPTHPGPAPAHGPDATQAATADAGLAQSLTPAHTPPDPTPEEAHARIIALATAEFGERRMIDWIASHPGEPFPIVWAERPDGTYKLHWLTREERRTLPATRRGRESKLVLP